MGQILVPTKSAEDWKKLLAQPDLHWKAGYSAMTLARSWEASAAKGFPPEVAKALATGPAGWTELRLLLAIPEYKVSLPGGSRASQTDLVAFARAESGLVTIAIEGKVDEPLGPTVGEKRAEKSDGVDTRLTYLEAALSLSAPCPDRIRYQLLHRTVSALLVANDFAANSAVMLVHSFSPTAKWHSEFAEFVALFGKAPVQGELVHLGDRDGIALYVGWCAGDQRFRADITAPVI